jgi:DNA-directed RNA polymerase subunit M/transcription elongation factor TFIIS
VQLDTDMQLKIIRQIERSCHNQTSFIANARDVPRNWENPMFVNIYNIIAYKIQKNLYIPGVENSYLIKNIINGNILAKDVGSMESKQLQPSKSQVIHNEIEKRKQQKVKKKYSMQYLCTKCGGRKTSELEFQSRSLDEGSTLIITCEMDNCSNKWTISS